MKNRLKYKGIFLYIITVTLFIAVSCYYDSDEWLYAGFEYNCDTNKVTYSKSIVPMMSLYCFTCHSNKKAAQYGDNITLEDYDDLKVYVDEGILLGAIKHEAAYSNMPKNASKLDDCKIKTFEKWIKAGAPQN